MLHFLITAGPTVEDLDPVRFISNRSSGRLGFALARAAARAGHRVTLIHGPVCGEVLRTAPKKGALAAVRSAEQMRAAVFQHVESADIVIMNAAVADFTPAKISAIKIKKGSGGLAIQLKPTVDILKALGKYKRKRKELVLIGFALETGSGRTPRARELKAMAAAIEKLETKNLDAIVLNSPATIGAAAGDFLLIEQKDGYRVAHRMHGNKAVLAKKLIRFATNLR